MREMIKMLVVLTILSTFSGGLLAAINNKTKDKIQLQILEFVKGPAIRKIFEGITNPIGLRLKTAKHREVFSSASLRVSPARLRSRLSAKAAMAAMWG